MDTTKINPDDIGSREREKSCMKEKRLSDQIINSLPGIFYIFDENMNFLRWNSSFSAVSGFSDNEIQKMNPLDFFSEDEKEKVSEAIKETFSKGISSVEAELISKNGTKTPYYLTGKQTELDGKIYLTGMGIDITEQKKAECVLRTKTEELEKFSDISVNRELKMIELKKKIEELEKVIKDSKISQSGDKTT
jgi:PAS domain S-box-containing protein